MRGQTVDLNLPFRLRTDGRPRVVSPIKKRRSVVFKDDNNGVGDHERSQLRRQRMQQPLKIGVGLQATYETQQSMNLASIQAWAGLGTALLKRSFHTRLRTPPIFTNAR